MERKIEAMHRYFGTLPDKRCVDCDNFIIRKWDKTYFKCKVYGTSQSLATDWRKKYVACGLFNKKWQGRPIVRILTVKEKKAIEMQPIEGQMEMEEL